MENHTGPKILNASSFGIVDFLFVRTSSYSPSPSLSGPNTTGLVKALAHKSSIVCLSSILSITVSVSEASRSAAPAQHLLEYYPVRFTSGFGNMNTIYQAPPSDAVDAAWSDLYNGTLFFACEIHQSRIVLFLRVWYIWDPRRRGSTIIHPNRPQHQWSISHRSLCISWAPLLGEYVDLSAARWDRSVFT